MPTSLLNALVVLPPERGGPRRTSLRFDSRRIVSLGDSPSRGDAVLDLDGRAVFPGLVNAHDHLELNHFPRTRFRPVYPNAHEWGQDFLARLEDEPFRSLRQKPLDARCEVGGLKNLRSGVTTVAHHNPLHRALRRRRFPVRVLRRYGWAHSLRFTPEAEVQASFRRTPRGAPWMIHLAEGTDEIAAGELSRLDVLGCLQANTLLIHGVGLSVAGRERALQARAGLVWCPSSNFFLLGQTAEVGEFAAAGLLALGTDSRLTSDGDMLDELRAAAGTGQLTAEQLFRAVTTDAARLLRIPEAGALLPGSLPDFFVTALPAALDDPYRALPQITGADIEQIYIGGQCRFNQTA